MAKNQTTTGSKGAYDKIYKAIRPVSDCPQSSKPLTTAPSSPSSPDLKKMTAEQISTEVPVHFNPSVSTTPTKQKDQTAKTHVNSRTESMNPVMLPKVASKTEQVKPRAERATPAEEGNDHKFSSYLDRAGAKIRTTSNVGVGVGGDGGGRSVSRWDDHEFSSYLDRAGAKIRTTSSVGVGVGVGGDGGRRRVSRRDSFHDKISHFITRSKIKFRNNV
ncbi:hypothetical protein Acr_17g0002450 [Actinidia rufa]|uniref:Uncharacterized protein n=1 Tax=Actinidia rufa TaxID=165716 RepID=A0A7J0G1M6_9ERIC|nr:hypothetical protein Acr_17g0002450 [Actinidia rufa]